MVCVTFDAASAAIEQKRQIFNTGLVYSTNLILFLSRFECPREILLSIMQKQSTLMFCHGRHLGRLSALLVTPIKFGPLKDDTPTRYKMRLELLPQCLAVIKVFWGQLKHEQNILCFTAHVVYEGVDWRQLVSDGPVVGPLRGRRM